MSVKYVSVCAVPAPSSAISGGNTSRIIQIERRHVKTTVLAYANDVTVFVTDPSTFPTIRRAISTYELANGAGLNPPPPPKSSALPFSVLEVDQQNQGLMK